MPLGIFKKQEESENFWSLVIGKNWVEAGIWRVLDEEAEVIAKGGASSWQEDDIETLIVSSDSSLSTAAATLSEQVPEPTKVVFGLSPSWVENGLIKKERLEILKKLSKELELSPAGFVVVPEAITHFLKVKEGASANAVLVGLAEDSIDLSLVQAGKTIETFEVSRSISLGQDVAEGLARFPGITEYPSRIILYNHRAGNLDEARQNLMDAKWSDLKIRFLHTPKIEILPEDASVVAVSLAGATEVAHAQNIALHDKTEEQEVAEEPVEEETEGELEEVSLEELGFAKDQDIAKIGIQGKESKEEDQELAEDKEPGSQISQDTEPTKRKTPTLLKLSFPAKNWSFSPPKLPSFNFGGLRLVFIAGAIFFLVFIGGGLAYWYIPKAEVTIYVSPKLLEKEIEFRVDPQVSVINQAERIVPARIVGVPVSGEKTGTASGAKTVGERTKGKAIVYNSGGSTTLKAGTALTGPGSLKFTLDEDTPIASGSSSANPSKTTASITASDIGAQYNLASGTEFSVGNFSKSGLSAKNEASLSGGTSREVSAVSKEDTDTLERELSSELAQQGTQSLRGSLVKEEILIEESVTFVSTNRSFSNKPGEEATTLKLSLEGKISATVVGKSSLNTLIEDELKKDIPQGFALRGDQTEIAYRKKEALEDARSKTKEPPKFIAQVRANLLPKVNPDEVARAIAGKYPAVAKEYLASNIPGFTRAETIFNIRLPGKLGTLPRILKNITVEVTAER